MTETTADAGAGAAGKPLPPVLTREAITAEQLQLLLTQVGRVASIICGLTRADPQYGAGVIEPGKTKCLWTADRERITITVTADGGFLAGVTQEPDPACAVYVAPAGEPPAEEAPRGA